MKKERLVSQVPSVKYGKMPGILLSVLSLFVWGAVIASASVQLTYASITIFAVLSSWIGIISGWYLAHTKIRSYLMAVMAVLLLLVTLFVSNFAKSSLLLASSFDAYSLHWFSDLIFWLAVPFFSITLLRSLSVRKSVFMLLEVGIAASILTALIADHRDGNLDRPLELIDWAFMQGYSPLIVFLILGSIFGISLVILLTSRKRIPHPWLNFTIIIVIALMLLFIISKVGTPLHFIRSSLGLTGKGKEEKSKKDEEKKGKEGKSQQRGKGQGSSGKSDDQDKQNGGSSSGGGSNSQSRNSMDELEMKNEYPEPSNAPVAVVILHDPYTPPSKMFYFRQTAFSLWNGRKLVKAVEGSVDNDLIDFFPSTEKKVPIDTLHFEMKDFKRVETTVALIADHTQPFGLTTGIIYNSTTNPNTQMFTRAYKVNSISFNGNYNNFLGLKAGSSKWNKQTFSHYTLASDDIRYKHLADSLSMLLKPEWRNDPVALSLIFINYLEKNGTYSRKNVHADYEDPTAHFLFGDKTGYCVHFAHALVMLLRTKNIPSRVGAGYTVPEKHRGRGSSILIRSGNAHAWPEIYLEGYGWLVFDISPEKRDEDQLQAPDQDLQRIMGEMARGDQEMEKKANQEIKKQQLPDINISDLLHSVISIVGLFLIITVFLLYSVKIYRRMIPSYSQKSRLALSYRASLDKLGEAGFVRNYGETRTAFAERIGLIEFIEITKLQVFNKLGNPLRSRKEFQAYQCKKLKNSINIWVKSNVPLWRRVLGLLNPVSWIWTK
ncbi:MAG: transglutaminase domain-containing protein [Candidatus Coatesbacteria bacterium]|nr:transglutaminase domain-containing protein [Candidatus Coatesbacteria bacterium]